MTQGADERRLARIGRAQVLLPTGQMAIDATTDIGQVLVQGTSVTTYNRTWYLGKVQQGDGWVSSRLGFANGTEVEIWDPETQDFSEASVTMGLTSPFVIRLSDLQVAFQLRGKDIKRQTFAHALQSLMREATGETWTVEPIVKEIAFRDWVASVDRVTRLSFRLLPPNPNYVGRETVQAMIEATGAAAVSLAVNASDDALEGLNTESDFLRQALEHVERGYGRVSGDGERVENGQVTKVAWSGDGEVPISEAPVGDTGEVDEAHLRDVVDSDEV